MNDEIEELQKRYDKLYLEFEEYKKKYNEEAINKLVKSRLKKIQSNNKYSLEEIKKYILSNSENIDILNSIEEIVINELEKENSKIYSEMLMRDILNYLYINRKDTILNNILFNGKSFIERSILNYDYTEENAVFAVEILKYYVVVINKEVAIAWFERLINSNMLNCLSENNESVIVELLYLSLYLNMDDVLFDNVDPIEIVVKARKYDYLWYELYNKFIIEDKKIYNKFAILKLYYNEIYLIDNRVKQICLSPIMKNIENLVSQYKSRKSEEKISRDIEIEKNNITEFNQANNNYRLLSIEFDSKSLNEESRLKKLGYSSTISRNEREKILKNKAIPQLGKARIMSHIEWLININKNKATMKNSVVEWRYDLDRLSRM